MTTLERAVRILLKPMCHRDDRATKTVPTVCSFCRSLLNAHHCSLSFSKIQAHSISHSFRGQRAPSYAFPHSPARPLAPLLHQSLGNIPSLSLAYGLPSRTLTSLLMNTGSH